MVASYRANAEGKTDAQVSAHSLYRRLGPEEGDCQTAYRTLVKAPMHAQIIESIRECTNKGWARHIPGAAERARTSVVQSV
jgi:hypothetical protein